MNPDQARTLIRDTFSQAFDKTRFLGFVRNLLNHFDESKSASMTVPKAFKQHVRSCWRLGTYRTPDSELADILIVSTTELHKLERTRSALRDFVAHKLKRDDSYKEAGLVAFVSPDTKTWRFSYVRMQYESSRDLETGKIITEERLTPARRFSYLVGEGESCHTAQTRFLDLLQETDTNPTLADIEEAFSVEPVSKEFDRTYRALFEGIEKQLQKLVEEDNAIRDEFKAKAVNTVDFAKKLMGQIVFLYFLQKKGWLGVAKCQDWGAGPHDFLRRLARGDHGAYSNFFNDVLEPLFYDTLATDRGHESWCNRFECRIPFLNGGLFEPLGDYDWYKTDIILPNRLFTNSDRIEEGVTGSGVLDVFDRYNFTVNEAEPLEREVAIDPEMLGRVFENLIEENRRKGLGAYYTPREIVHYMCQESLINYLDTALNTVDESVVPESPNQVGLFGAVRPEQTTFRTTITREKVPRADIETFVHLGDQAAPYEAARMSGTVSYRPQLPKSIERHARLIDDRLADMTICDPAVGSGAFPVGMMTEIVRGRSALTPYFNDVHERTPYHFKRHAIQSCLYGVDIDPGAVEIAKLRLWLSLVVDEEDVKQIKPLPNLDYKIVAGNSLIGFPFKSRGLDEIERLKQQFFDETDHRKKAKLKTHIDEQLEKAFAASKKSLGYEVDFDFQVYFSEVFQRGNGFAVTIGNPPYVRADEQSEAHRLLRNRILASTQYETLWEKWDLFVPFIEKAYKLLRPGGVTTMIVSDAFCHSKYAQKPQKWFLQNARVKRLDFCSRLKIFEAAVHNIIYCFQRDDGAHNRPERRVHRGTFGSVSLLPTDEQAKLTYRVFFPEEAQHGGFLRPTLPIGDICYISYGLAVSSDERLHKGEFVTEDVTQDHKDKKHPKPWVEGKLLAKWLPLGNRWLEWGTTRAPSHFRRVTFEELYEVSEKILIMRVAGDDLRSCYDDQQLYTNHTSIIAIPWHALRGVRNNSLRKVARYCGEKPSRPDLPTREDLEEVSRRFVVKYLLAVMNSTGARDFLRAHRRSNTDLYPDDWKKLPIPDVDALAQAPIVALVDRILAARRRDRSVDTAEWEREIDQLVCKLYGLREEVIPVVERGQP